MSKQGESDGKLAKLFEVEYLSDIEDAQVITKRIIENENLLEECSFYTSNLNMYSSRGGELFFYFGPKNVNPIFSNTKDAFEQLILSNRFYLPTEEEIQKVFDSVKSRKTLKFNLSKGAFKGDNGSDRDFRFIPSLRVYNHYFKKNPNQKKLAERIFGEGDDFISNMEKIEEVASIIEVYFLSPTEITKIENNDAFVMPCNLVNRTEGVPGHNQFYFTACAGVMGKTYKLPKKLLERLP